MSIQRRIYMQKAIVERLENQIVAIQRDGKSVSDDLIKIYYDQLEAAKKVLANLELENINQKVVVKFEN